MAIVVTCLFLICLGYPVKQHPTRQLHSSSQVYLMSEDESLAEFIQHLSGSDESDQKIVKQVSVNYTPFTLDSLCNLFGDIIRITTFSELTVFTS